MRRLIAGAVAAAILLTGCWPQLQIDINLNRTGTYRDGSVTISGMLNCSGGTPGAANGEWLDLFTTVTQNTPTGRVSTGEMELHDSCSRERKAWTETFEAPGFTVGSVYVHMTACTNPGYPEDEDCVTITRWVTLT